MNELISQSQEDVSAMNRTLSISEMFHSIQGEGRYVGTPAVFVRKSGCNLRCGGWHNQDIENQEDMHPSEDATWVCDSIEVFQQTETDGLVYDVWKEMDDRGLTDALDHPNCHLILTGGEPTMPASEDLLTMLVDELGQPFTEVETNGTILPGDLASVADQWNVSPKLSNSGMSKDRRFNPEALEWHARNEDSDFKFVISREQDVQEAREIINEFAIPADSVYLMPAGYSQEDLAVTAPEVAKLCMENGFKFSPRAHVDLWDQATGV